MNTTATATTDPVRASQAAQITASALGKRMAAALLANAPNDSVKVNVSGYTELTVRPSDRTAVKKSYYYGNPKLSTCGLVGEGACRLGGLPDAEFNDPYIYGRSVIDLQVVAARYGVCDHGTPNRTAYFFEGDIVIIDDGSGYDAHVICITSPTTVNADGSWSCGTVEGGQFSGVDCSATGVFTRTFVWRSGGLLYCGDRHVIAVCRWSRLELPTKEPFPASSPTVPDLTDGSAGEPVRDDAPVDATSNESGVQPTAANVAGPSTIVAWLRRTKAALAAIGTGIAAALKAHPIVIGILIALVVLIAVVWYFERTPRSRR
jgi:hypothetical protein